MSRRILIVPYDHDLLSRLRDWRVVLRVEYPERLREAAETVHNAGASLQALVVDSEAPLSLLSLQEEWRDLPLAFNVPALGRFADAVHRVAILRRMNARIFLSAGIGSNLTSARLLASLGVHVTLVLKDGVIDWDGLEDLAAYSYFALCPHASLEPFQYLLSHYHADDVTDFGAVYFDDPCRFLHLDQQGRVALTAEHLRRREFVAEGPEELGEIEKTGYYQDHSYSWQRHFLDYDACSSCPGYRICLGRVSHLGQAPHCSQFFFALMEMVERQQELQTKETKLWQL